MQVILVGDNRANAFFSKMCLIFLKLGSGLDKTHKGGSTGQEDLRRRAAI